jgi:hypothetical protein
VIGWIAFGLTLFGALAGAIWRYVREHSPEGLQRKMVAALRSRLSPCQSCLRSVEGHRLHELTAIWTGDKEAVDLVDAAIGTHDWKSAVGNYGYPVWADLMSYELLECTNTGEGTLYRSLSHADLDAPPDERSFVEKLSAEDTRQCLRILGRNPLQL